MYNIAMYFVQLGIAIAAIFDHKVRLLWRGQRAAFKTLKKNNAEMRLVNIGENFAEVLENTGLDAVFGVE